MMLSVRLMFDTNPMQLCVGNGVIVLFHKYKKGRYLAFGWKVSQRNAGNHTCYLRNCLNNPNNKHTNTIIIDLHHSWAIGVRTYYIVG